VDLPDFRRIVLRILKPILFHFWKKKPFQLTTNNNYRKGLKVIEGTRMKRICLIFAVWLLRINSDYSELRFAIQSVVKIKFRFNPFNQLHSRSNYKIKKSANKSTIKVDCWPINDV